MSYKPRSLFRLIEEMNASLFLPHIQRPFVWSQDQMVRLFDSLMRNYPIQTLLFWRTKDEIKARRFMEELDWDVNLSDYYDSNISKADIEKVLVLDGQQRLQTLLTLFAGTVKGTDGGSLEAYVDLTAGNSIDEDGLIYRPLFERTSPEPRYYRLRDLRERDAQRPPEEIADRTNDELDTLLTEPEADRRARQKAVRKNLSQLSSLLREDKHFWVQELDGVASDFKYRTVLDIFVRVNNGGTKLEAADLMFAAMKEKWSDIEERVEGISEMLSGSNLAVDKSLVLKCLVVAHDKGADLSPDKFTGPGADALVDKIEQDWPTAERAFQQLSDFIRNDLKLYSESAIRSYNSFVPLFDYLYHNPSPDEPTRNLMRAFHYKAQVFGWFRAQTDTVINVLHNRVGKSLTAFPMQDVKTYFRGYDTELAKKHVLDMRLRHIFLNLVYVDQFGISPFNVKYKGNEPHVDHIYPQSALRTVLSLQTSDINHIGNYRFLGATDNIRKRAERPAEYFSRLKSAGVDIERHLLLRTYAQNPSLLKFDMATYTAFRDGRASEIASIAARVVNPEVGGALCP